MIMMKTVGTSNSNNVSVLSVKQLDPTYRS